MNNPSKFIQKSYDDNDELAKNLFSKFIQTKGHTIKSTEEDYNHDIITNKEGKDYYFELEMKSNYPFYSKETYRFPTVSFLARKKRLHDIRPFYYVIICKETQVALMCHSSKIFKQTYQESIQLTHKERKGNDTFYRVPKELCRFFQL